MVVNLKSRSCKVWFLFIYVHFLYKQRLFLITFVSVILYCVSAGRSVFRKGIKKGICFPGGE